MGIKKREMIARTRKMKLFSFPVHTLDGRVLQKYYNEVK
jgi:hypothetical protein